MDSTQDSNHGDVAPSSDVIGEPDRILPNFVHASHTSAISEPSLSEQQSATADEQPRQSFSEAATESPNELKTFETSNHQDTCTTISIPESGSNPASPADHTNNSLQQPHDGSPVRFTTTEAVIEDYDPYNAANDDANSVRTPSHKLSSSTLSPSPASDNCSHLDLAASTASSVSSVSGQSMSSHQSEAGFHIKKRGYMRPQATNFSESAKSRESVLNLGSIAHLQYYFARTGLLDGKGGQLARKTSQMRSASLNASRGPSGEIATSPTTDQLTISEHGTPSEIDADWDRELAMLPPTVSTYNQKPAYVQPPPDLSMLRRELTEALENALQGLKDSDNGADEDNSQGWYEVQGIHLLDIITLAIRAAKNYYTAHSQYQRLHAIKSERTIRRELYQVLEVLKRMATRNFAGGLRQNEKVEILTWIVGISELIQTEINEEKKEAEERERWSWRHEDWTGREREREHTFLKCFVASPETLPEWKTLAAEDSQPTEFLRYFQDGLRLVQLHNTLVQKSQRSFEIIDKFHTDTNKPYRCAENLRFWIKAAELRWDVMLKIDVMGVVQSSSMDAWTQFDAAILQWCKGVREEFTQELSDVRDGNGKRTPPRLRIDRADSALSIRSASSTPLDSPAAHSVST